MTHEEKAELAKQLREIALALQYHPSGQWGAETVGPLEKAATLLTERDSTYSAYMQQETAKKMQAVHEAFDTASFPAVIEAKKQAVGELSYYRKMMGEPAGALPALTDEQVTALFFRFASTNEWGVPYLTTYKEGFVDIVSAAIATVQAPPKLTVRVVAFPESNGKRNWTAMFVRVLPWGGLVGNCGGITIARGELWNRVAYEAECAKLLIGERDTEPHILDYGDDIKTPEEWAGEVRGGRAVRAAPSPQGDGK